MRSSPIFKTAILDLDILVYRCGFSIESYDKETDTLNVEPVSHAYYNIDVMINKALELSKSEKHIGFLTIGGKDNFRYDIFPDYKANRKDSRRPYYYSDIREYLQKKHGAIMVYGQEADDACSIEQYRLNSNKFSEDKSESIIWSIDKDLNNVPGWHGNLTSGEIYYVDETQALKTFYLQILTGDVADGIPRIKKGWRQKESEEKLNEATTELEMLEIVRQEIRKVRDSEKETIMNMVVTSTGNKITEWDVYLMLLVDRDIRLRGQLCHLRRFEGETWLPPDIQPTGVQEYHQGDAA